MTGWIRALAAVVVLVGFTLGTLAAPRPVTGADCGIALFDSGDDGGSPDVVVVETVEFVVPVRVAVAVDSSRQLASITPAARVLACAPKTSPPPWS